MIPGAAVEAAYGAINYLDQPAIDRDEIRIILEVAAPHLMAQAYDEGFDRGSENYHRDNPYR